MDYTNELIIAVQKELELSPNTGGKVMMAYGYVLDVIERHSEGFKLDAFDSLIFQLSRPIEHGTIEAVKMAYGYIVRKMQANVKKGEYHINPNSPLGQGYGFVGTQGYSQ